MTETSDSVRSPSWLGRTVRKTFLSLRTRNFRLYFTGQLISNTGNWLTNVALICWCSRSRGAGSRSACSPRASLAHFFLSAWGGYRRSFDKRHMLFISQSLEMAQSIVSLSWLSCRTATRRSLYPRALWRDIPCVHNPFRRSFVAEMVPPEDIPNAVVLYSTIVNVSAYSVRRLRTPCNDVGLWLCFTIDAASYIAVIVGIIMMRPAELYRDRTNVASSDRRGNTRRRPLRAHDAVLMDQLCGARRIGTLAYNFSVTLPLFVTNTLHGGDGLFTILYSVFGLGSLCVR